YEGAVHGKQGYALLALSVVLTAVDLLNFFRRIVTWVRSGEKLQPRHFWNSVIRGKENDSGAIELEYAHLVAEEPEEIPPPSPPPHKRVHYEADDQHGITAQWAND
ncbi:hypothetical protein MPER_14003, partial [Moniliophthora perniciosa FA553]